MPTAKPASPTWNPGHALAAGAFIAPLFNEGSGTPWDYARNVPLGVTGSPTWQSGAFGSQVGGFSTTAYYTADDAPTLIGTTYPCYEAIGFTLAGAAGTVYLGGASSTSSSTPVFLIRTTGSNGIEGFVRPNSGGANLGPSASATTMAGQGISLVDGNPHVVMMIAWSDALREIWVDGISQGSNTTSLGAITAAAFTLGVMRRTSVDSATFPGSIWVAQAGKLAVPDPAALAADWLAGTFSAWQMTAGGLLVPNTLALLGVG